MVADTPSVNAADANASATLEAFIYVAEHFPILIWVVVGLVIAIVILLAYVVFSGRTISSKWITIAGRPPKQTLGAEIEATLDDLSGQLYQVENTLEGRIKELRQQEERHVLERTKLHKVYGSRDGDIFGGSAFRQRIERCQAETNALHDSIASKLEEISATLRDLLRTAES